MKSGNRKSIVCVLARLGSRALTGALLAGLAWQLSTTAAFAQTKPAVELEAAIAKEQVDGDLKTAVAAYLKIAAETSASRDVRARALLHLAGCYEKLGQQAQKVYEQIVRDFADQPAAAQARARLASYSARQLPALKELKPQRLTANTPELPIRTAALSPDGKSVAYSDALGIHLRSVAGGETRLLPGTQGHVVAQWAPDGNSLQTYVQDAAGVGTDMVVSLRGGAPTSLPASDQSVPSPDRTHRATVSVDGLRLSVQDANGGNSRERWKAAGKSTLGQCQWSPNGKLIAIASWENDAVVSTLEMIDIASGQTRVLIPAAKKLFVGAIVWATQNRMIVAIDEGRGVNQSNSNLWELRLDDSGALISGGLRRLTSWADFPIRNRSLTTDGKRLLFIRSFQQRDVYVAPLEAGGTRMGTPRRLTLDLGDDYPTGWTRDSKTVILTSDRNGQQAMFRQDLDKQTADQIVVMPGIQAAPRVTPDGKSVLFHINPAHKDGQLMRVPIAGGTPEPVPNTAQVRFDYRCAPDSICVMAQLQNKEYTISELDPVKGKGREIYRDDHLGTFDLSPDGKWIAILSGNGSGPKITLRSTATGAVAREIPVQGSTTVLSMVYALDGKGFFLGDGSLPEVRELHLDLDGKVSVLWHQPTAHSIWAHPSPDGKYLALVMWTDESNVYMVENF